MEKSREYLKAQKGKRRLLRGFLFALLFLAIAASGFAYKFYSDVAKATDKMNEAAVQEVSDKREEELEFRKDPFSILLVGVDEREGDHGRTDSLLVATINPETKSTKLISIPRDTRTLIVGKNKKDKINHAYAYGGIQMTIDSIENFLDIPLDYYVEVNMEGFKDIVDALGGIDVNNAFAFELDGVELAAGNVHLDGEHALQYARMRKEDPNGDFGRQKRQREVIQKIVDKGVRLSSLTKYTDILNAVEKNIKTSFTLKEMLGIQMYYKDAAQNIEQIEIPGEGKKLDDGVWYYTVSEKDRKELSNKLLEHLNLKPTTTQTNTETETSTTKTAN